MDMVHTDALEDVLRRLPPRALAVSRCVCKAWRATVDRRRLLRADLLPLSLDAVIFDVDHIAAPKLFARRSTTRYITGRLDYLDNGPGGWGELAGEMKDYCNGLVLIVDNKVVNPATRQWASLPRLSCACSRTKNCGRCYNNRYLVYDPTVSPHYEVFFVPRVPLDVPADTPCKEEWPPSPYVMYVFSSKMNCWKERSFTREGDAPGITIDDVKSHWKSDWSLYYSAYWKGSLYVPSRHREGGFILRINLSKEKYQIIKLPEGGKGSLFRIGKSKKGIYCVLDIDGRCSFQVWFLSESCGQIEWVLHNEINFESSKIKYHCKHIANGPWISQSPDQEELLLKNDFNLKLVDEYNEARAKDGFGWDSDDEYVVSTLDWPKNRISGVNALFFSCLGFHPYKEIVLFHDDRSDATMAYELNSSKVRYLGIMELPQSDLEISFAYTPCWTMDLPGSN
ncbi:hypothetical protein ACQ4PT_053277 [Festuca glaucescens]